MKSHDTKSRRMQRVILTMFMVLIPYVCFSQSSDVRIIPVMIESEGVILSGDFYVPVRARAALVLVHGSGRTNRMTNIAQLFAAHGFAVVTWDKRGVAKSGGAYEADRNTSPENLALLAGDAAAAMNFISARPEAMNIPLGYWGISQAGWIVPLAAQRTPQVDFMTLWSGPVCTVTEEMEAGIGNGGNMSGDDNARAFISELRRRHMDTDPRDALRQLDIPGLWLFGGRDDTLPVELSIQRLKSLVDAGQTQYEYRLTPEVGHFMNVPADSSAVNAMIEWMQARRNIH